MTKTQQPGTTKVRALPVWLMPPNLISFARLGMAPLAAWFILSDMPRAAFWVFLIAGVSDAVDGLLARWLDMRSNLGSMLDPAGDKALVVATFVTLGIQGHIPMWLVALVVIRDLCLVTATGLLYLRAGALKPLSPTRVSKLNTLCQLVLAAVALATLAFSLPLTFLPMETVLTTLIWLTAATTVLSGFGYLIRLVRSADTEQSLR